MTIKNNINLLLQELNKHRCRLVAVSKTHPPGKIMEAYETGHRLFGENKVQELVRKREALPKDIEWHMIGHLQTNKVKHIVPFVSLIHSIDSQKLLHEVNQQAARIGRIVPCLLQVHIAEESTKFGLDEDELKIIISSLKAYPFARVEGLMGMATLTENEDQIRKEFGMIRGIWEALKANQAGAAYEMKELSIGMSSDYAIAMEQGSTMVRIGSAIFGERTYTP
jgi:hypothetical protein